MQKNLSIILPAKNEAESLKTLLPTLTKAYPHADVVVVNDGSTDETGSLAEQWASQVVHHPHSMGNGAAIKSGLRAAVGKWVLIMDSDGQHRVEDIARLLETQQQTQADMVVAKRHRKAQASTLRWLGNRCYNHLASWIVQQPVDDLTSGFRLFEREKAMPFLHLLPNGFSSPSTLTLTFFRSGYRVVYPEIEVQPRIGKSHLRVFRDGFRFFILLYKMAILFSPLRIFLPLAFIHLISGIGYAIWTLIEHSRFTNMSLLLITVGILILLIGMVSEQITILMYQQKDRS